MLERLRRLIRGTETREPARQPPLVLRAPRLLAREHGWACAAALDGHPDLEVHVHGEPLDDLPVTPASAPFIPIAILLAARAGRELHVDFPVEDGWWFTLRESLVPLVAAYYDFRPPTLTRAGGVAQPMPTGNGRGLLFSAGVDSFFTLGRMALAGTPPDWLVCVNAGAHGPHRGAWERKLAAVTEVARTENLGVLAVDTNFHEIFPLHHRISHTFRNFAAALALHPWVDHFVYSASNTFAEVQWEDAKANRLSSLDYFVTGSLLPPGMRVTHAGWGASRPEKTAEVACLPVAASLLDVCVNQRYQAERSAHAPPNCGHCAKCARTILTLEHFGFLQIFSRCFPPGLPGAGRADMLGRLQTSNHSLDQEVIRLLERK